MAPHYHHQHQGLGSEQLIPNVDDTINVNEKGAFGRINTAGLIIACGVINIIFGISLIVTYKEQEWHYYENIGWGIWIGAFAIITGCVGICSRRNIYFIVSYMVLCIACILQTLIGILWSSKVIASVISDNSITSGRIVLFCLTCCVFVVQMMFNVIGALYTFHPVCHCKRTPQNSHVVNCQPSDLWDESRPVPVPPFTISSVPMAGLPPSYTFYNNDPPPAYHR